MAEFGLEAGGDATVSMEMGPSGVTWWTPSNSALWWPAAMAMNVGMRECVVRTVYGYEPL